MRWSWREQEVSLSGFPPEGWLRLLSNGILTWTISIPYILAHSSQFMQKLMCDADERSLTEPYSPLQQNPACVLVLFGVFYRLLTPLFMASAWQLAAVLEVFFCASTSDRNGFIFPFIVTFRWSLSVHKRRVPLWASACLSNWLLKWGRATNSTSYISMKWGWFHVPCWSCYWNSEEQIWFHRIDTENTYNPPSIYDRLICQIFLEYRVTKRAGREPFP